MLGLRFCARAFSSCGKRGPVFIAVRGSLIVAASLVAEHRLQTRRLSNCGSRAQLLRGMWDLPRPGLEPVSPALAVRFSTTAPPGKPPQEIFLIRVFNSRSPLQPSSKGWVTLPVSTHRWQGLLSANTSPAAWILLCKHRNPQFPASWVTATVTEVEGPQAFWASLPGSVG